MRHGFRFAAVLLIAGACSASLAAPPAASGPGSAGRHQDGPAAETDEAPLAIAFTVAGYGKLVIATRPGATCRARAVLPSGSVVLAGDFVVAQVANSNGQAIWTYRTPIAAVGPGTGRYEVSCTSGERSVDATARFEVP